ncbi:MAG: hypothetical protein ACJAT3_001145 [Akkermansiaceae bacterium]
MAKINCSTDDGTIVAVASGIKGIGIEGPMSDEFGVATAGGYAGK